MRRFLLIALCAVLSPLSAEAACSSPAGAESQVIYSNTYHSYEYCNGTSWQSFAGLDPAAGGGGCTSPTGVESQLIYSNTYHTYDFCDGTNWMAVGGHAASAASAKGCATVGSICSDNSIYVGSQPYTGKSLFVHQNEQGALAFSTESVTTGATSWKDGAANQASIQANNTIANYPAFKACADLNTANSLGHNDWFLPSMIEEYVVYGAGPSFASGATQLQSSDYWSSTDVGGSSACRMVRNGTGQPTASCYYKSNNYYVRCVRAE